MLKTETRKIGEYTYKVRQLPAVQARAALLRFTKLFAPALTEIEGDGVGSSKALRAISKVAETISPEDLDYFCDLFAKSTDVVMVDDKGVTREPKLSTIIAAHFEGDTLVDMFEWLYFCFEVNFAGFFARLGARHATKAAAATESK